MEVIHRVWTKGSLANEIRKDESDNNQADG